MTIRLSLVAAFILFVLVRVIAFTSVGVSIIVFLVRTLVVIGIVVLVLNFIGLGT